MGCCCSSDAKKELAITILYARVDQLREDVNAMLQLQNSQNKRLSQIKE